MKTRMRIILLCFGMILSAAEDVKKNLTGVVGGNITLPDSLTEFGFLIHNSVNIAFVNNREVEMLEEIYKDKLHWNKNTGKFTIKNLQKNHSGIYNFDSKKGNVFKSAYILMVYDPAPSPAVRRLNITDGCMLLCSVDKKTKLSWYKDRKILNQSSSDLSLLLTVDKQDFDSSYKCLSENPAESKTFSVDVNHFCRDGNTAGGLDVTIKRHYWILIIVVVCGILMVLLAVVMIRRKILWQKKTIRQTQDSEQKEDNVTYTQIRTDADRQHQGGRFPDPSGPVQHPNSLTTVYDKLEAHRILPDPVRV